MLTALTLALVTQLGSDSWRDRERADAALARCRSAALPALLWGEKSADPEIAARCRRIADGHFQAVADRWREPEAFPSVHRLPHDWPGRAKLINSLMKRASLACVWQDSEHATRLLCHDLLLARTPPAEVDDLLRRMRKTEPTDWHLWD